MQMMIMKGSGRQGWRWTKQRRIIVQALEGRTDHPTAEELYRELKGQGHDISLATVYRNLRALAREGKVMELHGKQADRFDPNTKPHYHFLCLSCGRIYDVDIPYQTELDHLDLGPGFRIIGHELTLKGICPHCQEGKEEPCIK